MNKMSTENKASDLEIISKVLAGEVDLYEVIVRRYNGYIYKVGRAYGFHHEDVEDLMQETYVNAFKNLKSFEGRSSFKTWLVKIMLHQCFHKKQKLSFQNEKAASEVLENEALPIYKNETSDGNKIVQELELKQIIEEAILRIPEAYRMVFSLRELTGLSTADTAEMLHISEDNVKVRLNRAKKVLQAEIEKSYSVAELFEFNLIYCDGMVERVMQAIKNL
jgi:RNA polymerase sigma-70 factor (ECF subfamily)